MDPDGGMKEVFRVVGKATLVAVGALGALLSGCGASDQSSPPSTAATVAEVQSSSRAPSAELLNSMLQRALDPNVPATDKLNLVQGATAADAPLFNELVRLRTENPTLTWQITNVHLVSDGHAVASISALVNSANQRGEVQLTFDQGRWKLDGQYACDLLKQFGRSAPSCGH